MIGRVAFWLLGPGLVATVAALGLLLERAGHPSYLDETIDLIGMLAAVVVILVLLVSMTWQALLILRRAQSLTTRRLPTPIAVLQISLYGVLGLWVTLLAQLPVGAFSALFALTVMGLSIALMTLISRWRPEPSERLDEVALPSGIWVALCAYCLVAVVGLMYAVASSLSPELDPDGNRSIIVLLALGLPVSLLVLPIAVITLLAGFTISMPVVAAVPVLANVTAVLLMLWPRNRARLVNWFFRLGRV